MGIADPRFDVTTPAGWQAALAALAWQVDLGLTEPVGDAALSAFDLPEKAAGTPAPADPAAAPPRRSATVGPAATPQSADDPVAAARIASAAAATLPDLHAALAAYPHCDLRRGARNTVFADGTPAARVLVLGEAPGRDEDLEGRPFVGAAGQMLDRMFAAIGLSRTSPDTQTALYITNVMPWRPPQNRDPDAGEIAMMLPFVARHIDLADPDVVVTMGNTPLFAATGQRGITRQRGQWTQGFGRPLLPMLHPAYLLRTPQAKREAWADLLSLQAWLRK